MVARKETELTEGVESWQACSDLCSRRRGCRYWTWHHKDAGQYSFRCVTMTDVSARVADSSAVSGTSKCRNLSIPSFQCPDVSYNTRGRIDAELTEGVASWSACSDLCRARRGCRCVTMTDVDTRVSDNNAVSGTKKCEGISFS